MRDIEKKAMALLNASEKKMGLYKTKKPPYELPSYVALYLSIEQHEAFKQEVSDAAEEYNEAVDQMGWYGFDRFIIPNPDPLVEAWIEATGNTVGMEPLNAALEARGLEIREKGQ
jgi:hypothetical protein